MKKILFIHNSTPEYRMVFWDELRRIIECDFLITNANLSSDIYKFDNDISELKFEYWDGGTYEKLKSNIRDYFCVVLPPQDSMLEIKVAHKVMKLCEHNHIRMVYWSEKWEADWSLQPIKKKIKSLIQREVIGSVAKRCNKCIAAGSKSEKYLQMIGVPKEKIGIAYDSSTSPLIEYENIRSKYNIEKDKRIILFLGRLVPRKGCFYLIKCIKEKLKILNAVLLICGDGEDFERCKEIAHGNPDVIFAGMVQPSARRNYYEQSDVFVIPSICENGVIEAWGLTVNEALECGLPVVATDVVGSAWDVVNGENGEMVKTINEIPQAISKIFSLELDKKSIKESFSIYDVNNMARSFACIIGSME